MNDIAAAMAKLAGIRRAVRIILEKPTTFPERGIYDPEEVTEYFWAYDRAAASLRTGLPEIFADLPYRGTPESSRTTDFNGGGFVGRQPLERLLQDIDYIFEVRSNSELEVPLRSPDRESRIFIAHGPRSALA